MRQQVKFTLLGCAVAALAAAVSPADATVYNVNRTIDGGSVVGTITTDGATGTIRPYGFHLRGICSWSDWARRRIITNTDSNAAVWGQGVDITADATNVFFNFSGNDGGFLVFQDGQGSGNKYWCVDAGNDACGASEAVVPQHFDDGTHSLQIERGIRSSRPQP